MSGGGLGSVVEAEIFDFRVQCRAFEARENGWNICGRSLFNENGDGSETSR